ncbi:MAG TPA: hypothetical protein VFV34_08805 [Blastocatellia bacterium]|nr:hypothetical protein [Blastocatellia bacterium]
MNLTQMDAPNAVKLRVERRHADQGMGGNEVNRSNNLSTERVRRLLPVRPPPFIRFDDFTGGAPRKLDTTGLGHG